ncbi:MAG TPA: TetR/AcrR family transcriptional regulator [Chthoniobacterales bacterium]|jgi:AcrR family transcriptional regulator
MRIRPKRRLPANQRRQSILDAAMSVLSAEGYAGTTTARVAQRVGISEPILYRHFSSKRDLLRALLDEIITRMLAAFQELIKEQTDPVKALRLICHAYPELSQRYEREFRIINQTLVQTDDPKTQEMLADHYRAYHAFLEKLIAQGQKSGVFRRDIPASVGAWHIIQAALGYLMTQNIRPVYSSRDFASLTNVILEGLMKIA